MRVLLLALVLSLLAASCAKKPSEDKCKKVIDKSMKVLGEIAALRGAKQLGKEERDVLIKQCKEATKNDRPDAEVDCVLAAKDDAGVRNCYMKGYEEHLAKSKAIEAKVQLDKIAKNAKGAYEANREFPKGKVGPTPANPCCSEQIKQCIPAEKMWDAWKLLDFAIEGAFHYQYTYESADGKSFTAAATGDIGCTGNPTTTTITGTIGANGEVEITKP